MNEKLCRCCGKKVNEEDAVYDSDVDEYFCSEECQQKWIGGLLDIAVEGWKKERDSFDGS